MSNDNQIIVYVHGIGTHSAGFSDSWYDAMRPHLPADIERTEVLWSDIVNTPMRLTMEASMEGHEEMNRMKAAIHEIMIDRLSQLPPEETPDDVTAEAMSGRQATSLLSFSIDDFVFYMFNSFVRNQILGRFEQVVSTHLAAGRRIHLITHSWGTVVAYEGLRRLESAQVSGRVSNFFTVGSALSISPVQSNLLERVANGARPAQCDRWINLDAKWDVIGGRIGGAFAVDTEHLGLKPRGCGAFLGIVNPSCAHSSYFHDANKAVNKRIFAAGIGSGS